MKLNDLMNMWGRSASSGLSSLESSLHNKLNQVGQDLQKQIPQYNPQSENPVVKSVLTATAPGVQSFLSGGFKGYANQMATAKAPSPETLVMGFMGGGFDENVAAGLKGISEDLLPLAKEALKYDSAEEFVKAITEDRGGIGAGVEYSPAKRMVETNINDTPLTNFGFKPEDKVTIYRGVDRASQKTIQNGDYIATSYDLAKSYTGGRVISKEVPASSVRFSSGDGITAGDFKNGFNETHLEGVYNPEPLVKQSQLTDIFNKVKGK